MIKTLLITTGGTLSCMPTPEGLMPTLKGKDILEFSDYKCDVLDFKLIDSSVMTDEDRNEIAKIIWDNQSYDSFVITHGTDSMAYTAAYLSCALKNFGKTIVITGSQLPLVYQDTDAKDNINLALSTALSGDYYGVCLAINHRLISAKTATKMDTEDMIAFASVTKEYLTKQLPKPVGEKQLCEPSTDMVGILYITPNLLKETILSYKNMKSLIVLVLGAGGMPQSCEQALEQLKEMGVNIYIKSQCFYGKVEAVYAAHSGVKKFLPINNVSLEYGLYSLMFGCI